jgi:hypothetical protein
VVEFDPVVGIGSVLCQAPGATSSSRTGGQTAALSVMTSVGDGPCSSARVKNRRVAAMSRFWETSTSMTCPNWSIARYR